MAIFGSNYDFGMSPVFMDEDITGTTLRETEKEPICLRFATEPSEGYGWSIFTGNNWVAPKSNWGIIKLIDVYENIRTICFDENDFKSYEVFTFDRRNFIRPPAIDKEEVQDTEVDWEKWGPTYEDQFLEHVESKVGVRPQYPEDRGVSGYDTTGLRDAFTLDLECYVDGEKITPKAITEEIPLDGDIVFNGVNLEHKRIQMVVKGTSGEVHITHHRHFFQRKDKAGTIAQRTMSERTLQTLLASGKKFHMSRGKDKLLNRVTGISFSDVAAKIIAEGTIYRDQANTIEVLLEDRNLPGEYYTGSSLSNIDQVAYLYDSDGGTPQLWGLNNSWSYNGEYWQLSLTQSESNKAQGFGVINLSADEIQPNKNIAITIEDTAPTEVVTDLITEATGPDGRGNTAFYTNYALDLGAKLSGTSEYTIILWLKTFAVDALTGITLTEFQNDSDSGYSLAYAQGASLDWSTLQIPAGLYVFDPRGYSSQLSNLTTILANIYRDVTQNNGRAYIPRY